MKGLILNNLYSVEKSIKSSTFIAIAAVILLILTQNSAALRAAAMLPFLLIPPQAFEVLKHDAMSGWNKFEMTLPVKRRKIVQSKYLTFLLLFFMSVLLTFVLFYIANLFIMLPFTNVFNFLLRGMGAVLCIAAIIYPMTYILGTEKSDTIMISSMGFTFGMFFLVFILLQMIVGTSEGFDEIFSVTFFVASIFLFIVSYLISNIVYTKKEF